MDDDFRILVAEKELAHYKEMQAMMHAHHDGDDQSIAALGSKLQRIEATFREHGDGISTR